MPKIEKQKILAMFDYLNNPTLDLKRSDGAIVFGRADPLLAKKISEVHGSNKVGYFVITGGIGKDSGYLADLGIPEAAYQAALAHTIHGVPANMIHVEPNATNGGENCRFSIDKIFEKDLPYDEMLILAHATSLRRLSAMMENEGPAKNFLANYQRVGTNYLFDPENPIDQKEAVGELLRLADWPAKGWCAPQPDLPEDLVQYAREIKESL